MFLSARGLMDTVHLDGSEGEGGGQILRTALSLSAITSRPLRIERIRARRSKPGLLRQHLTAVKAAAQVCSAHVEGAELGSSRLEFRPGPVHGGRFHFSIGTAGSACLVCQTVLPILLHAAEASEAVFEGGTHNPMAPSYDFLAEAFFPLLRRMGAGVSSELDAYGFYPAGGGRFRVSIAPAELGALELLEPGDARVDATAIVTNLPRHIAERELAAVKKAFRLDEAACRVREVPSAGPGNALAIRIAGATTELVTGFGERGKRAERVAAGAIAEARELLDAGVPVGRHLADQLLLPMALGAGGGFRTLSPSQHFSTNAEVIRRFVEVEIRAREESEGRWLVTIRR